MVKSHARAHALRQVPTATRRAGRAQRYAGSPTARKTPATAHEDFSVTSVHSFSFFLFSSFDIERRREEEVMQVAEREVYREMHLGKKI